MTVKFHSVIIWEVKILFLFAIRQRSIISWEHLPNHQGVFFWWKGGRLCLQQDMISLVSAFALCSELQLYAGMDRNSAPSQGNPPVLLHLLIACLTDGVGLSLWKKQLTYFQIVKIITWSVCSEIENLMMSTFDNRASLQTLNGFFFILFWNW